MTHTKASLSAILSQRGLRPSRALGQNFVIDPNTVRKVARLAGVGAGDQVLEIGAGLGSLSVALAETGATVTAVEFDRHLLEPLREVVEPHGVRVVHGDALTLDYDELLGEGTWTMVSNLPYNVAAPIVLHLLESVPPVTAMLVMVQLEVGERLVAGPGSPAFGGASLRVAYFAEARLVARVAPTVFLPRPRVDSALVEIRRRPTPAIDPTRVTAERLFEVVRTAFAQRRKMLRRSLAGVVPDTAFAAAGIEPTQRPEELGLEEFARLAEAT